MTTVHETDQEPTQTPRHLIPSFKIIKNTLADLDQKGQRLSVVPEVRDSTLLPHEGDHFSTDEDLEAEVADEWQNVDTERGRALFIAKMDQSDDVPEMIHSNDASPVGIKVGGYESSAKERFWRDHDRISQSGHGMNLKMSRVQMKDPGRAKAKEYKNLDVN